MTFREFYQRILMLNVADYENLSLDLNINIVVLALGLGIAIAVLASGIFRSTIFTLVKQLTRHEASSPETAKTLASMSLSDKRFVRAMSFSQIRSMITYVGEGAESAATDDKEEGRAKAAAEIDPASTLLYLRASGATGAKRVLERYDASLLGSVIFSVVILMIAVCSIFLMPSILDLINVIMG